MSSEKPRPKKLSFYDEVYKSSRKSYEETEKSSRKSFEEAEKSPRRAPFFSDAAKSFRKSTEKLPSLNLQDEKYWRSSRKIPLLGTANKFDFRKTVEKAKTEAKIGNREDYF
jgi:hypothetical protein